MYNKLITTILGLAISVNSLASSITITMYAVAEVGHGKKLGTITAVETPQGVLFKPKLTGFAAQPNLRGFHVHAGSRCDNFGQAAGGHLDPENTGKHSGPYDAEGHLGDIQALMLNHDGSATMPVFAPKLTLADIQGHTLIIHAHGDNYADHPQPLGGGGDRIACGVILQKR